MISLNLSKNNIKLIIVLIFATLMVSMLGVSSAVELNQVDVGLIYGNNNQFPIGVTSQTGFIFGEGFQETFNPILDFSAYTQLVFYKDGFYDKSGTILDTALTDLYTKNQVFGGYHVQIGPTFDDYDSILGHYSSVSSVDSEAYLVYDDGWRVFSGSYVNETEAKIHLTEISPNYAPDQLQIAIPNFNRVIVSTGEKVLFSYDGSEGDLNFKTSAFEVGGLKYRNSFRVYRKIGSDFTFVNRVTMNEYIYGVVPREMGAGWPLEAVKAQAIASKNYVLTSSTKYLSWGFDVCNTTASQVYGGLNAEVPAINQAIDEISGVYATHQGKVVPLYFHSHSGGVTDNSENVWNAPLPYIKSTIDPYSIGYPNTNWSVTLNKAEIEQRLIVAGYNIGSLQKINILERVSSGRVYKLELIGNTGKVTLEKDKIRSVLGSSVIKSLLFSFDEKTATASIDQFTTTESNMVKEPASMQVATAIPVMKVSNSGIYAEKVDSNQIKIIESGSERIEQINFEALKNAKDIYSFGEITSNPYLYNSTESFDITTGNVVFYGHGFGHGLGMSQWGAKKMAESGKTYEDILKFYFKDIEITK